MATIPTTSTTLLRVMGSDFTSRRWDEFVAKYEASMRGFVQSEFLSNGVVIDVDEAIQDTMLVLVEKLPEYYYDPDVKGHFRNYLMGILRNKCREQLKSRQRLKDKVEHFKSVTSSADEKFEQSKAELRDFRIEAYETALIQLRHDPKILDKTFRIFEHVAIRGESPEDVAKLFGVTRNNVDQIRSRLTGRLRELAKELADVG